MMLRGSTPFPWKMNTITVLRRLRQRTEAYSSKMLAMILDSPAKEDWDFIAAAPELVRELLAAVKEGK